MLNLQKSSKGKNNFSLIKFVSGLSILVLGVLVILNKDQSNQIITSTFADEPVRVEEFKLEATAGDKPKRLVIPSQKIDLNIEEAKIVNGYWEVFADKAGWGEGTGVPGESGNQVIFAHAKEGLFLPLRSIKEGKKIYIMTKDKYFEYEVKEIKEVLPSQVEVIKNTEDETLTLYTCSGFADSKRLVVVGKRIIN